MRNYSTLFILALVLLISCGPFAKLEKSTNWEELYNGANKYYQEGEYNKAIILYEKVLPVIKGSEKAEMAEYNYANCHFKTKRFIESAGYFNTFYKTYNRSAMAEEALFMNAYSLYLDAPDYNLDQQSSKEAVNAIQQFVSRFPASASYERAMEMLKDLESRFEEKAYSEAEMYYRLKEGLFPGDFFRACIINFQNFAKDYPESKRNEELAYRLVEVGYAYAKNSAFDKKEERLTDALKFATTFYRKYPTSGYLGDVKKFEEQTKQEFAAHSKMKQEIADRKAAVVTGSDSSSN
ncbi:MAG: outer membrane protein assembly factor BamD [Algoriphagus sp.]|jgi:outer membrane protein assembly factor BamD|uniref:outer membrane protein assembly factor BamD n=1 Tax=Algoriphagus sp. TaxID=1872435 RepID=UPI002764F309|nr:outer membrane protein assembly factor BamD [Algoriphagus sp.]MDP4748370.1 outer membrane protein assembly factor BamD [Algoriphagus sp.]MDP4839694.1 outer membrane protein assembly factor BamD [Algoriphagus sp.]MDP4904608.1 outer membrane protein assembly factor BamD [Algoriphagus sp.]MDP4957737.1 outer membrane protein assembly factor BamD [Algoriphagus sp.]